MPMARTANPHSQFTRGLNMIKQGTQLCNQAKTGFKGYTKGGTSLAARRTQKKTGRWGGRQRQNVIG